MALPTKGRVIIDTTVGELDIELWSKVCRLSVHPERSKAELGVGNTEDMSELHCVGYGRPVRILQTVGNSCA